MALASYTKSYNLQIVGTSEKLAEAYEQSIKAHGGTILTGKTAEKIDILGDYNFKVITADTKNENTKTEYTSSFVVSVIDPFHTFYNPETGKDGLIGRANTPEATRQIIDSVKTQPEQETHVSNSLFVVYLPLDETCSR